MQRTVGCRVKLEELGGRSVKIRLLIALAASLELTLRCGGAQIHLKVERELADHAAPFLKISRRATASPLVITGGRPSLVARSQGAFCSIIVMSCAPYPAAR